MIGEGSVFLPLVCWHGDAKLHSSLLVASARRRYWYDVFGLAALLGDPVRRDAVAPQFPMPGWILVGRVQNGLVRECRRHRLPSGSSVVWRRGYFPVAYAAEVIRPDHRVRILSRHARLSSILTLGSYTARLPCCGHRQHSGHSCFSPGTAARRGPW